ncbi:MAG: hypothetical protein AAFY57_02210 [Cyanobacteria bacterium J06642_2]
MMQIIRSKAGIDWFACITGNRNLYLRSAIALVALYQQHLGSKQSQIIEASDFQDKFSSTFTPFVDKTVAEIYTRN